MPRSSTSIQFAAKTSMVGLIVKVTAFGGSPIPDSSFRIEIEGPGSLEPGRVVKEAKITTGWDAAAAVRCYKVDREAGEGRNVSITLTAIYDDILSEILFMEAVRSQQD
jgi:hypothetical protein